MHFLHININIFILSLHMINHYLNDYTMINFINIFNKFHAESGDNKLKDDKELVKYFKSEFGNEWKIELDKYLIRTEYDIDKKVA